jgi:filamentous hemagglutinin
LILLTCVYLCRADVAQLKQTIEDNAMWAPGGSARMLITALTAAAGGNVTGTGAEFLQSAAVNYLQSLGAQQVKAIADELDSDAARAALHGLLACGGAAAQGQSCGTAAAGASASVVINNLIKSIDSKDVSGLNAEEKEARINLVTSLIAGITEAAGGDAAVASTAAKIEMENNAIAIPFVLGVGGLICYATPGCKKLLEQAMRGSLEALGELGRLFPDISLPPSLIPDFQPPLEGYPAGEARGPDIESYPASEERGPDILVTPRPEVQGPDIETYPDHSWVQGSNIVVQEGGSDNLGGKAPNSDLNQQLFNDLYAGKLPGTPIGGLGTPREMPASPNPSATAEDFANRFFGGTKPSDATPIPGCDGCWYARSNDGTVVTYRPAGQASEKTLSTTATVDINSPSVNHLNASKNGDPQYLKLKFPVL